MSNASYHIDKALRRFSNPADFCRSLTTVYLAMGEADRSKLVIALIAEIAAREVSARCGESAFPENSRASS